jgi:hypothetical protein
VGLEVQLHTFFTSALDRTLLSLTNEVINLMQSQLTVFLYVFDMHTAVNITLFA